MKRPIGKNEGFGLACAGLDSPELMQNGILILNLKPSSKIQNMPLIKRRGQEQGWKQGWKQGWT